MVQVPWFITHWLGEFSLPNQATMICDTEAPLIILTFLHFSLFSFSYLLFSTSLLSPSLPPLPASLLSPSLPPLPASLLSPSLPHYLLFPPPSCPLHFLATSSSRLPPVPFTSSLSPLPASLLSPSLPHYLLFSTPLPLLPSPPLSPALFPLPFSLSALPPSLPPTSALSPLLRYYDQLGAFENKLPISESQVFPY